MLGKSFQSVRWAASKLRFLDPDGSFWLAPGSLNVLKWCICKIKILLSGNMKGLLSIYIRWARTRLHDVVAAAPLCHMWIHAEVPFSVQVFLGKGVCWEPCVLISAGGQRWGQIFLHGLKISTSLMDETKYEYSAANGTRKQTYFEPVKVKQLPSSWSSIGVHF